MAMLTAVIRACAGLLLISAAIGKLTDRARFTAIVKNYQLLPIAIVPAAAAMVPILEVLIAGLLLSRANPLYGSVGAALLLVAFAAAIAINLRRGRSHIACGCFGADDTSPLHWWHVLQNVALAALALLTALPSASASLATLRTTDRLAAIFVAAIILLCWWLGRLAHDIFRRNAIEIQTMK